MPRHILVNTFTSPLQILSNISRQKSLSLLALFFFAFGDVLSEEFLQGAEDQLAMESYPSHITEITDIPSYSQKTLKGLQEDRIHKRKSERAMDGRNWKTDEEPNSNLGRAKNEMNCSDPIPFSKLERVNCRNLNDKKGYEIYSFVDANGTKKLISEGSEDINAFDPQTKIRSSEDPSKSSVASHVLRKRLSSNANIQPLNFRVKQQASRNRQSAHPLNPKTALNSQSVMVHVLPPDPNYSANVLNPQSKLASNNINEVSSYVNYNLPAPIFRNIMNENGQLVQQFIDAKPIPHKTLHLHQHSPTMTRQSNPGPAYNPVLVPQQHHLHQRDQGVPRTNSKLDDQINNKNDPGRIFQKTKSSKHNGHKIQNSPESSYSKISSNPSSYQQPHDEDDEKDSQFKRGHKGQNHLNAFRKEESNTEPHDSQERHDNDHNPDDEQNNYKAHTDESITRGPDYTDSEEDTESKNHPPHAEQEHPGGEDSSNNHSQESNDYDYDPSTEADHEHQHNQEGSSPTHEQRKKYEDNEDEQDGENHSSQEVNSYDGPNSSEDNLHHSQKPNNHKHESSDRIPKHHEGLNNFFYGDEKKDDEGTVKYVNLVDKEEIEKDKNEHHKKKQRENNDNSKYNYDNHARNKAGNNLQTNRDKNHYAEPHHSNHNYIVRHGQHNGLNQHVEEQVPVVNNNQNTNYVQRKTTYHPQNIAYPGPQLYHVNGVVRNRLPIKGGNAPNQYIHLQSNQVYNAKPHVISSNSHPNTGYYENNANAIPYHVLLKQSNIPLTFHHLHPTPHHGSNQISSINNKNIYNDHDTKIKKHVVNRDEKRNSHLSRPHFNNNKNNIKDNDEKGNPIHHHSKNLKYKEDSSNSEVNLPSQERHDDRKYKEVTSVNEEELTPSHRHYHDGESSNEEGNPNHPPEDEDGHDEEKASSAEEDAPNIHSHDSVGRYQDEGASSNEEEVPDRQRQDSNDRSRHNNDDASSNEEESPVHQQSKHTERLNNDDESSSHETENATHHDNDEETTGNDEVVVEDNDDEAGSDNNQSDNENNSDNEERHDQKVPKHKYKNNPNNEEDIESDEQSSPEEKKSLFKKHFENEFGNNQSSENSRYLPSNFIPSLKHPRNERMQNKHKLRQESRHSLPLNEDFSDNRRSFNVESKNQQNVQKFVVAASARKLEDNSRIKTHEDASISSILPQKDGFKFGVQSQDIAADPNQLSKSNSENNHTKVKIPHFESFGDFFFNSF